MNANNELLELDLKMELDRQESMVRKLTRDLQFHIAMAQQIRTALNGNTVINQAPPILTPIEVGG